MLLDLVSLFFLKEVKVFIKAEHFNATITDKLNVFYLEWDNWLDTLDIHFLREDILKNEGVCGNSFFIYFVKCIVYTVRRFKKNQSINHCYMYNLRIMFYYYYLLYYVYV